MIRRFQSLAVAALLALIMWFLPISTELWVSVCHVIIWAVFVFYSVGIPFLWMPGPSSWFIITMVAFYASWNVFYISGSLFFEETTSFSAVCEFPLTGVETDRDCFLFTSFAWMVVKAFIQQGVFAADFDASKIPGVKLTDTTRIAAFLFGLIGAICSLPRFQLVGALSQPVLLLSYWFQASLAVLILDAAKTHLLSYKFQIVILQVAIFGTLGFLSSGLKGALFLTLLHIFWLIGGLYQQHRRMTIIVAGAILVGFIQVLPAFQQAKQTFGETRSAEKAAESLSDSLSDLASGRMTLEGDDGKSAAEATWQYLGIRLCVAGMTQKYLNMYGRVPHREGTIGIAIESMLPRLIVPNKRSSNLVYNELARKSGIGSVDDFETSRKPTFIDECIINFGHSGSWIGGLLFGLYLFVIERSIVAVSRSLTVTTVLRFSMLTFGQLPYFAVITGSVPYTFIFIAITVTYFLNRLDLLVVPPLAGQRPQSEFAPQSPRYR